MTGGSGKPDLARLETRIGHQFADRGLLQEALTHTSVMRPATRPPGNYQRLEFLGDRVLGLMVADMLFHRFPDSKEGELSRRLSELVRKETCAQVAEGWDVGPHIIFGPGVARTASRGNRSILAGYLRIGDRRGLCRWRIRGGPQRCRAGFPGCLRRCCARAARTPRRPCRNGYRRGGLRRPVTAWWSAPGPNTRRVSPSRFPGRASSRSWASAPASAPQNRMPPKRR